MSNSFANFFEKIFTKSEYYIGIVSFSINNKNI